MESGEHMPNKKDFVNELYRVTAPGGRIIIVTWCHRYVRAMRTCTHFQRDLRFISLLFSTIFYYFYYSILLYCTLLLCALLSTSSSFCPIPSLTRELEEGETKLKDKEYRLLDKINDGNLPFEFIFYFIFLLCSKRHYYLML